MSDSRPEAPDPWHDLDAFVATPRLGDLVLAPDGSSLLVAVSGPNPTTTGYTTSWWRLDPAGRQPARRLTRSVEGESAAVFTAELDLLFTSKRPAPPARAEVGAEPESPADDTAVLWCLPAGGGTI